jgi:hypothetical protein
MKYYSIALVVLAATAAHAAPVVRKRTSHSQHQSLTTAASAINSDETYDPYLGLVIISRRGLQPEGEEEAKQPPAEDVVEPEKDMPMKEEEATTLPGTVEDTMSMAGSESMSMSIGQEGTGYGYGIMDDIGNAFPPDVTTSSATTASIICSTLAIFGAAATGVVMFV